MDDQISIGFLIRELSNLLRRKLVENASPPSQAEKPSETAGWIISFLCDQEGKELYQKDVEEAFSIRRSTASRFLIQLERAGMISRQSVSHDARRKKLVPTEKARAIHQEVITKRDSMERLMRKGISQEELDAFYHTAEKIARNLME